MIQRIIVAVIGIPLLLAILCVAPDWATAARLAALSVVGTHELLAAVCGPEKTRRWTALPAVMGILVVLHFYGAGHGWQLPLGIVDGLLLVGVIALPAAGVLTYGKPHALTLLDVCVMALAGLAIPDSFSCLLLQRMLPHGGGLVLVPLVGGTVLLSRQQLSRQLRQAARSQQGVAVQLPRESARLTVLVCTAGEQPGFVQAYLHASQN